MAGLNLRYASALLMTGIATPAWAGDGRLGGGGTIDFSLTRLLLSLLLCLMIAVVVALLLKRTGGRIPLPSLRRVAGRLPAVTRRIEVIESRRISPHADVCLIRCDGREYLLLCAQQQQSVLRETDVAAPVQQPTGAQPEGRQ